MNRKDLIDNIDKLESFPFISGLCNKCKNIYADNYDRADCMAMTPIIPCANVKLCYQFEGVVEDGNE